MVPKIADKIASLEKKVANNPKHLDALYSLGALYLETGRHSDALKCFFRRVKINPESAYNHCSLGWAYLHVGEFKNALESYTKACKISPDLVLALSGQTDSFYRLGKNEDAYKNIKKLLSNKISEPNNSVAALRVFSKICHEYKRCDECIDIIKTTLKSTELDKESRISLSYALAALLDKTGEYKNAYKYYRKANRLTSSVYSYEAERKMNDAIISSFTLSGLPDPVHLNNSSMHPIFILGMPRSGTTLVEQILSKHPDVYPAGELTTVTEVANVLYDQCNYPFSLEKLSEHVLGQATNYYLAAVNKISQGKSNVTDKMPANYMHLGLIYLLFPNATIIHTQRNPMDVCLSIYFQRFPSAHNYSFDLKNIVLNYFEYARLMRHWKSVLPIKIHNLYYEELVMDQEKVSRSLIESCDLKWNASVLNFFDTQYVAKTASQDQVKHKMYETSLNRWKNYESCIPLEIKQMLLNEQNQYMKKLKT